MPFITPIASFHPDHMAAATAPNGIIRLVISCHGEDCAAGAMTVRVLDASDGEVLARGRVECTGQDRVHDLEMIPVRLLQTVNARLSFQCGDEEQPGRTNLIFVQCMRS